MWPLVSVTLEQDGKQDRYVWGQSTRPSDFAANGRFSINVYSPGYCQIRVHQSRSV